jgi:hypothetical protein
MQKSTFRISSNILIAMAIVSARAEAQNSINVQLSRTTGASQTIVTTENAPITIPYFTGTTYDAADTSDSGTYWNSLIAPTVTMANTSGSQLTFTVAQNLSLVDSMNNPSSVEISSIQFSENNGKTDGINQTGISTGNPGSDGLSANPTQLENQSWFDNGTSEYMIFNLSGLVAGNAYNLYIYGAGSGLGYGGSFTVPMANQGSGYNTAANAYNTEPSSSSIYRSVVNGANNPTPEEGLSWTLVPVVADANGDLSFDVMKDGLSGIKGSINGFQLQAVAAPEPSTLALASLGSLGLLLNYRRRMRS